MHQGQIKREIFEPTFVEVSLKPKKCIASFVVMDPGRNSRKNLKYLRLKSKKENVTIKTTLKATELLIRTGWCFDIRSFVIAPGADKGREKFEPSFVEVSIKPKKCFASLVVMDPGRNSRNVFCNT